MQRFLLRLLFIICIITLFVIVLSGDSLQGYISSLFYKKMILLEKSGIKLDFNEKRMVFFDTYLKDVKIKSTRFEIDVEKINIKLDFIGSILSRKLVYKVSLYYGDILIFAENIQSNNLKDSFGFSRIFLSGINIKVKKLLYNNKITDLNVNDITSNVKIDFNKNITFLLKNKNLELDLEKTGDRYSGELKAKSLSVDDYSNFLLDLNNITLSNGVFDADISFDISEKEVHYSGYVSLNNTKINIKGFPFDINSFKGKIEIDDDKRRFIRNSLLFSGKKYELDGLLERRKSIDITLKDIEDNKNFLKINGKINKPDITGNINIYNTYIDIKKKNNLKVEIKNEYFNSILFYDFNNKRGNFRLSFFEKINIWGDIYLDLLNKEFFTEKSFLRYGKKIYNISLESREDLKLRVEDIFDLDYGYKDEKLKTSINTLFFKDEFSGFFNKKENIFFLESSNGSILVKNKNIEKLNYSLNVDKMNIQNIFLSKINLDLKKENKHIFIDGKCDSILLSNIEYKNIKINGSTKNHNLRISSGDMQLDLKKDLFLTGVLNNFEYKSMIKNIPVFLSIDEGYIDQTEQGDIFIKPEKMNIKIDNIQFDYISGIIEFKDGKLNSDNIKVSYKNDIFHVTFDFDGERFEYSINGSGDERLTIYNTIFKNKVIRIEGINSQFSGHILFEKSNFDMFPDNIISGKISFDKNGFIFEDLKLEYLNNNFSLNGKSDIFGNDVMLKISTENKSKKIIIDNSFISANGEVNGVVSLVKNNKNWSLAGHVFLNDSLVKLKQNLDNKNLFEFKDLKIDFKNMDFNYQGNSIIANGNIYFDKEKKPDININFVSGKIDVIGTSFNVVRGNISSSDVYSKKLDKIINIKSDKNLLKTEFTADKDYSAYKNKEGFDFIKNVLWFDLLLKKEINNVIIYASIKGNGDDTNLYLYSEPEMEQKEIYEIIRKNSIFSFIDSDSSLERVIEFLRFEKSFIKRFTKEFNFDSVDFNKDDDNYNVNLKKGLSDKIFLNYEKGILKDDSALSLEYHFTDQFRLESEKRDDKNFLKLKWKIKF